MRRVADYRGNARACRELARRMPPSQREQLKTIAAEWDRLAEEQESAVNDDAPSRRQP